MSIVTNVLLQTGGLEDAGWSRVQSWLAERLPGPLTRIERQCTRTGKAMEVDIGIGAYNFMTSAARRDGDPIGMNGIDLFVEVVTTAPWVFRGNVVLVIQPDQKPPIVLALEGDTL